MNHPPSRRRAFPNGCEPASSIRLAGSGQDVLTCCQRVIRSQRPDLQMVVAEDLIRASCLPEPRPHLIADSVRPTHRPCPAHRRRRACVGGEIRRQIAAIPASGSRVENCSYGGNVGGRDHRDRRSRTGLRSAANRKRDRKQSPSTRYSHSFSGTSLKLVPHGSVRIHSPFSGLAS